MKALRVMFFDAIGTKAGWIIFAILLIGSTLLYGLSAAIGALLGIDVIYVLIVQVVMALMYEWYTNAKDRADKE